MNEPSKNETMPKVKTELEQVTESLKEKVVEIKGLKGQIVEMNYHIEMMGDVARMNAATQILAAVVAEDGDMDQYETGRAIERSIKMADDLISHYQDLMEKKSAEQRKIMDDMENDRKPENPDQTVQ